MQKPRRAQAKLGIGRAAMPDVARDATTPAKGNGMLMRIFAGSGP